MLSLAYAGNKAVGREKGRPKSTKVVLIYFEPLIKLLSLKAHLIKNAIDALLA